MSKPELMTAGIGIVCALVVIAVMLFGFSRPRKVLAVILA